MGPYLRLSVVVADPSTPSAIPPMSSSSAHNPSASFRRNDPPVSCHCPADLDKHRTRRKLEAFGALKAQMYRSGILARALSLLWQLWQCESCGVRELRGLRIQTRPGSQSQGDRC